MKKKFVRVLIILLITAILVVFIVYAIFGRSQDFMLEAEPYPVQLATIDKEVSANGTIDAVKRETLVAQITGEILKVNVKKGDRVSPGQVIALMDPENTLVKQREILAALEMTKRNVRSELFNLRTLYTQAKAEAEQAEREHSTIKQLKELGSASEEQLLRALDRKNYTSTNLLSVRQRLNFREGRALDDPRVSLSLSDDLIVENSPEVKQIQAQLSTISSNLKRTEIKASIKGIVLELPAEKGMVVSPGMKLAVIANLENLKITANIDEVDIGYIKLGQSVRVESDVFLNSTLKGEVIAISPLIQRIGEARVCEITIGLFDPEKKAKIGASCSIYINVLNKTDIPAIPLELYLIEDRKKYVYVMKPVLGQSNTYLLEKRQIETGVLGLEKIEIISGLQTGELVARGNLKAFRDGIKVRSSKH